MSYTEITSVQQFNDIINQNEYVIVDFYASWCGPCKTLAAEFDGIKSKFPQLTIVKINIDEETLESIVESHNVSSLPNVFLYRNKAVAESFIGNNKDSLWKMAEKSVS